MVLARCLVATASRRVWLGTLPQMHSPVRRPLDALVIFMILVSTAYLPPLLSFRQKLGFIVLVILGCVALLYIDKSIGQHYLGFIFFPVFFTAASLWQSQSPTRLSFIESVRYVRHMPRHEPSEAEARLLAAVRSRRKLNKT